MLIPIASFTQLVMSGGVTVVTPVALSVVVAAINAGAVE